MNVQDVLAQLGEKNIVLHAKSGELVVRAPKGAITPEIMALIKQHKAVLLQAVPESGSAPAATSKKLTPDLLPLVQLEQGAIDGIVANVPGGVANIQDIYPLAPLQEGILFHHLLDQTAGDAYLMRSVVAFDSRQRMDTFLQALQAVIDRHDILRSAVHWEGLPQPVQVVHRHATLPVHELALSPDAAVLPQLLAQTDPRKVRLDVRHAPILAAYVTRDAASGEWLLSLLRHHMVCDHVTMDLILSEIRLLLQGEGERLPKAMPYRNFIARTHAVPASEHEAYFRRTLGDMDEPTAPFGVLDVQGDGDAVNETRIDFSDELAQRIRLSARQHGVTPAVLFHVGWAQVLARCSGREDVVFGTVLSGRLQGSEGADRVVGMFINTLPIRIPLAGKNVGTAIGDTYARLSELLTHEQASLALAQRCSGVKPPLPLFTTLLNYRYSHGAGSSVDAVWQGTRLLSGDAGMTYPLTMSVEDRGEGFGLVAQCVQGIDSVRLVRYLETAMQGLLDAIGNASEQFIATLDILPAAEREAVLQTFNATEEEMLGDRLIHELFEAQVLAQPDADAVVFEDQVLSYAALNRRANQVAHQLIALGVKPDDRVAICVERSVEMIVGLLGILKAGAAYVPLDPTYPLERLGYMLSDSAPTALLTQSALRSGLPMLATAALPLVVIDDHSLAQMADRNPDPKALGMTPRHLAYVIYTSGSTGQPKGVMVEHRGLCNLARAQIDRFGVSASSQVLQFASFSFDASIFEVVMALCSGACLHVASRDALRPGEPLMDTLQKRAITHVTLPSSVLMTLDHTAPSLEGLTLIIAGEAFPPALAGQWAGRHRLINAYGPTENTVCATTFEIGSVAADARSVPIGAPMANTQVYILDAYRQPVPVGVTGELYLGGAQVARGYLNRPELTAERFVADPFGNGADARLYKSGDLGRWLPDGTIEYLGRNDFQVKIRGFRIELGEIEARLAALAGVREAAVIAREDVAGDKRLVAYVVADEGAEVSASSLREALAQQLAEYMIPSAFVRMDALPLTANGKLDRKALPAPDQSAIASRAYEAPVGDVEQAIADIWQELLGVERVGRNDHFFELGGHSLLAMRVVTRLRERKGITLPLRDVFAQPTIHGIARLLNIADPSASSAPSGERRPLSWIQQRLWFFDRLDQQGRIVHQSPLAWHIRGKLDTAALQAALDRLVVRHRALRTRFIVVNGAPMQTDTTEPQRFALIADDWSGLDEPAQASALVELSASESRTAFDLSNGPPVRGRLLRLGEQAHVLLVTAHPIVSDGGPYILPMDELGALYAACLEGQGDPLPAPAERGAADAAAIEFWRVRLQGAPALLELPADRARAVVQTHAGGRLRAQLPDALTAALRSLARGHGTTLATTLLAGWSTLLSRLSGQTDLVIGTYVGDAGYAAAIDLQPMRIDLSAEPTVVQLLTRIDAALCDAAPHLLPFGDVVEALQPEHSFGHEPLFQTSFAHETAATGVTAFAGLHATPYVLPSFAARLDLSLSLKESAGALDATLDYATDLFDAATVARWWQHWINLLDAMTCDAQSRIDTLPMMTPEQRLQVLEGFNTTRVAYPAGRTLHALFEDQVARDPHAAALAFDGQTLTYDQLNRRANRLAHCLIEQGVRPDDRVGIFAERSIAMVVGFLAIIKAGGAYLPLDPTYPAERLNYMLADSEPVALLAPTAQRAAAQALTAEMSIAVLALDEDGGQPSMQEANPVVSGLTSRHLAYVVYTSGSTGQPKGVMTEHRNVVRLVIDNRYAPVGSGDCVAHFANPAFDATTWELWGALLNGARVLVVPQEVVLDAGRLNRTLVDGRVTALFITVGLFNQYVDRLADAFGRLKYLLVGGDVLDPRTLARVLESAQPPQHLISCYGPTESTTYATTHPVTAIGPDTRSIPIGRPIANTTVFILDARRQPVPLGVTGELHIGGPGVARGYLNRPELTAERFVADLFDGDAEARLYKTGDLGRWMPDGTIEFLGRNDFQVKIRGFRIELGEIEARLSACAGVRQAVVVARQEGAGEKRLVAYVVPQPGFALSASALRDALSQELADYMIPSAFVRMEALPLTQNGKLDRASLPAPDLSAVASRAYEAPVGEVEETIAAIWQSLLGVERVGRNDHFFELGGHSLLIVQLVTHVRESMGVELSLRDLFAQPTLEGMVRSLAKAGIAVLPPILAVDRSEPLPLSWSQQRLWFLDQLDHAAGAAYHMPSALRLQGTLDRSALRAALNRIVARHENLRTTFVIVADAPTQAIAPEDSEFLLIDHDMRSLDDAARVAAVATLSREEASAPFDLAAGPLIRGRLLRCGDSDHVLLLTQHHIISDGWSSGLLVKEVSTLYTAFCQGHDDPLPPLAIQYADYAVWQRRWLHGDALKAQLDFWRSHLTGAPALLELPTDRPRPVLQTYAGERVHLRLPVELAADLRAMSQRHGITVFMSLLAAWSVLMTRLSGQDEVVVGTPVANRQHSKIEPLIGFFVNTLALRVNLQADPTVGELLDQVRTTTLAAYAHQDLPFEQVVEALQPARSMSYSPVFQTVLSLNNTPGRGEVKLPGLRLLPLETRRHTAHFDLDLALGDTGETLAGNFAYASGLFDRATVERFANYFVAVLTAMVADDTHKVSHLQWLAPAEREAVLRTFNATEEEMLGDRLIHELFEAQVLAQPDADAVVFEDQVLSYAALNRRANQVAHQLIALGVKPDDRVAICVERSVEMIVGLLGILKAGAAYVPLDPTYPLERLGYMLSDSAPTALLTQSALRSGLPMLATAALPLVVIDDHSLAQMADRNPDPKALGMTPRHLAYVIYTSGSTGQPKGVMVEHRGLCNLARAQIDRFGVSASSQVLQFASFSFDASISEVVMTLCSGACLHVASRDALRPGEPLMDTLQKRAITHVTLPSSVLMTLDHTAPSLEGLTLIIAGEAFPPALAGQWAGRHRLINAYGPTENTVCATTFEIGSVAADARSVPIGAPMANTQVYILDAYRQPVPVGVTGELYLGGAQVARGYLNRPELTAERFVADPFGNGADARLYKSGDLGRWLPDGTIEYLGRNDFQVKIRGFRIELGEIEARLAALAGVREAAVIAREDVAGDKRLVAYVVADEGAEVSASSLREALAQQLAEYMIPSAFVRMDALPLTANGKLDRKALPAPDQSAIASRAYEAPVGDVEQAIADIWQELLGVERVGRNDHFFELGGHSLLATRVIVRLKDALQIEIDLRDLFNAPQLSALAAIASERQFAQFDQSELLAVLRSMQDAESAVT